MGGIRKSPIYFLYPSYWRGYSPDRIKDDAYKSIPQDDEYRQNFESVSEMLKYQEDKNQTMKIRNLVKDFGGKLAVDHLNMDLYSNQIFALLGNLFLNLK
jgi:hypothetical protein